MLTRLEIENFYSVRSRQVLDFTVAKTAPSADRFATLFSKEKLRVPKVLSLFGANASGKTTILRAISFMREFADDSFSDYDPGEPINVFPFDHGRSRKKPTRLAMEFCPFKLKENNRRIFRYELEIDNSTDVNFVSHESLKFRIPGRKYYSIFDRSMNNGRLRIETSDLLNLSESDPRKEVRGNVSLLSSLKQYGHDEGTHYSNLIKYPFITNIHLSRFQFTEKYVSSYLNKHKDALNHLNRLIRIIDVGIEEVKLIEIDGEKTAVFKHAGLSNFKTLAFESQGTQNFFCLFPNLTYSLSTGSTAVLDEIDSDLHPSLLFEIVRWYRDKLENPDDAQLLMSCQHASLLNELWKEEAFFVEKDPRGATKVWRLADLDNLRRDTNLYKKYMAGEFGALPRFG